MTQSKVPIPRELMVAESAKDLFSFLAAQIETFLAAHHSDHFGTHVRKRQLGEVQEPYREEAEEIDLGFTFSFPVNQVGINKGTLLRWTKGFDIPDAVGQDVCKLLQDALDARHLPVRVAALVNDTVGTLMARSYCSPGSSKALIGAIFGTGTNGAYVEKQRRITKLTQINSDTEYDKSTGEMVINTEWGSFDNHLSVLPNTPYDKDLDANSVNPGIQMFEKRISGMFLGEVLRSAILSMVNHPAASLFSSARIPRNSRLHVPWSIDASFLSTVEADTTEDLQVTEHEIKKVLNIDDVSLTDCQAVKLLVHAIGRRAARLSAVALAGIVISTNRLATDEIVDIGVDGSLVEFYPGFEAHLREAFREIPEIGVDGDQRIRIGIAKDGSGVGAALAALVAKRVLQSV
jgi:hexokinase